MNKDLVVVETQPLWKAYGGITIANSEQTQIQSISQYIKVLTQKETTKIVTAFDAQMFDMGVEYAWHRAMKKLDERLEVFGLDFIAEMVGVEYLDSIDSVSKKEKIDLAFELGMIDKTARMKLSQANEKINHYMSDDAQDELNYIESLAIMVDLTQYILGNNIDVNSIEFKQFREKLLSQIFSPTDKEVELLQSSPYFFIKTTIRTILNLIKTTENTEKSKVLNNAIIFITALWEKLFVEDKKNIGKTYAQAINDGDKEVFKTLSTILDKVQGYDYVPETTRSNAYIKVAKAYISTHYEMNNFYNEPAYAKKLNSMGTIIPDFALGECLEATLISMIGNQYGVSTAAQESNKKLLEKVTYEQWKEFFSTLILQSQNILQDLYIANSSMLNRWYEIVENYVPKDFNIKDVTAKNIYSYSIAKNKKVSSECGVALEKIVGK